MDSNRLSRAFGTAVHRCTEALLHRPALPSGVDAALSALLRTALLEEGCEPALLDQYLERGTHALQRLLDDPWARWMLDPGRTDRAAELSLTMAEEGGCRQLILDYLFRDEQRDEYWVVDYKTSVPADGQDEEAFFRQEAERYREQLADYALAVGAVKEVPVRTALYFVSLGTHLEVDVRAGGAVA